MWLQRGVQIDTYPWAGSYREGEILYKENNDVFLHSGEILKNIDL